MLTCMMLTASLLSTQTVNATEAADDAVLNEAVSEAASWIMSHSDFSTYDNFTDWDAIALTRSGYDLEADYFQATYQYVSTNFKRLRKVTDLERVVLSVTAMGNDPTYIAGYDFIDAIVNHRRMTSQGINGPVFALLALDSNDYEVPDDATWNRENLVAWILQQQNDDGGFSLTTGFTSDVDLTAMTLQALASYQENVQVQEATDRALTWLSSQQYSSGGFPGAWGESSESASQVMIALTSLGIDLHDPRFVKDGNDVLTYLLSYQQEDGGISHSLDGSSDNIATQQALLALSSLQRVNNGQPSIYDMQDIKAQTLYVEIEAGTSYTLPQALSNRDNTKPMRLYFNILPDANGDVTLPAVYAARGSNVLEIENGTEIGSPWNKNMLAPTVLVEPSLYESSLNEMLEKEGKQDFISTAVYAVNVGDPNGIELSEHATVILQGQGHKEAAYVMADGSLKGIPKYEAATIRSVTTSVYDGSIHRVASSSTDMHHTHASVTERVYVDASLQEILSSPVSVTEAVYANDVMYAYEQNGDLVIKTKQLQGLLAFLATKKQGEDPDDDSGDTSDPNQPAKQTVTLSVEKRTIDEGDILSTTTVEIQEGDTVFTVLKRVLNDKGISLSYVGSNAKLYVDGIDGLFEFDAGPNSGWMYSVNGSYPQYSAGIYDLQDGDRIRWRYTTDLGKDIGGYLGSDEEKESSEENAPKNINEDAYVQTLNNVSNWIQKHVDFTMHDHFHDWDAIALARSGEAVPDGYSKALQAFIKENEGSFRKVTDVERMVLAITALGKDATSFAGYNLIEYIVNHPNMTMQGTNGPVFALIALDANNYTVPEQALWDREKLSQWILEQQNEDGGFPLHLDENENTDSDIDITAMVLQALAPYQDKKEVKEATELALAWLSEMQLDNGGFTAWGDENSETISQMIIALTALNIDVYDERFVKKDGDLLSALTSFILADGGVAHVQGEDSDFIATQQAMLAFAAYDRYLAGENRLYDMTDTASLSHFIDAASISDWAYDSVASVVARGFMQGIDPLQPQFAPKQHITRAAFATLLVNMLQEQPAIASKTLPFNDVKADAWYYDGVSQAYALEFIYGNTDTTFAPYRTITREEMAVMLERWYVFHQGEGNNKPSTLKNDVLDYTLISDWALESVEHMYGLGMMQGDGQSFHPQESVTREMAAVVIANMLEQQ